MTLPHLSRKAERGFALGWSLMGIAGTVAFLMVLSGIPGALLRLPELAELPVAAPLSQSSKLLDVHGKLIADLHGEENRIVVPPDHIPYWFRDAVVAVEDAAFYSHRGISVEGIGRSLFKNISAGRVKQGGSTITQQYMRNAFPEEIGKDKSLLRKAREAVLAMRFEQTHSKSEILNLYLNTVYFGRGAYGAEAAARTYFGKRAAKLNVPEAAFLAGIIKAPEVYESDLKAATARRDFVLHRMNDEGYLNAANLALSLKTKVVIAEKKPEPVRAAYFVEYVRRLLITPVAKGGFGLTSKAVLTGGLTIHTTLDLRMQDAAERAVAAVLDRPDDPEVGFVAMTTTGEIRAMVGGRNFTSLERARGFNFAAQTGKGLGRPAGSAFKPFTLAAYVNRGMSVRKVYPAPARVTVPKCGAPGKPWSPANYQNTAYGSLDVIDGTRLSVNTVYAQMVEDIGPTAAMQIARSAGITSPLDPVCSIALGTFGVTPLEMARAYSTLAARGVRPNVLAVTKVTRPDGKVVLQRKPVSRRTIPAKTVDIVNQILARVMTSGTGTPARISRPAAGKTGTTDDHRDVWFAGFTPHPGLSAAAWIGYPPDKNRVIKPMLSLHGRPATGGGFSGRIWKLFMDEALKGMPVRQFAGADFGPAPTPPKPKVSEPPPASPKPAAKPTDKPRRKPRARHQPVASTEPSPSPATEQSPNPD